MDKEKVKEYNKQYYAENKTRIGQMLSTRESCDICGKVVAKSSMSRHKKTACRKPKFIVTQEEFTALMKKIEELEKAK